MAYKFNRKRLVLVILIITGLILSATGVVFVNSRQDSQPPAVTANQNTKGENTQSGDSSSSSSNANQKTQSGALDNSVLLAPSGDFVSNHRPNLSGSPAPNLITSVCQTTPGAKCSISFTSGSTTKTLASQTADSGGAVYWLNWKLQDTGITAGSWKIVATATLNGQSKSSTDAINLEVAQ